RVGRRRVPAHHVVPPRVPRPVGHPEPAVTDAPGGVPADGTGPPIDPVALARHYTRFRVAERLLLTGHSHQAWPDVALDGVVEAFTAAAEAVDDKWALAAARAEEVRDAVRGLLDDPGGEIALGPSTH